MKYKDIKSMGTEELASKLQELKKELMKQNTQRATGTQLKNPMVIKNLRRDIAKILYLLNQQENTVKKA
jgi:large subunit ribosomal protein L29